MFDTHLLGESRTDFLARLDGRGVFAEWVALAPKLSGGGTLHAVADVFRALEPGSDRLNWDPLLGALLQVASPDGGGDESDAVLAVLHAMARGAVRLVRRGFDEGWCSDNSPSPFVPFRGGPVHERCPRICCSTPSTRCAARPVRHVCRPGGG